MSPKVSQTVGSVKLESSKLQSTEPYSTADETYRRRRRRTVVHPDLRHRGQIFSLTALIVAASVIFLIVVSVFHQQKDHEQVVLLKQELREKLNNTDSQQNLLDTEKLESIVRKAHKPLNDEIERLQENIWMLIQDIQKLNETRKRRDEAGERRNKTRERRDQAGEIHDEELKVLRDQNEVLNRTINDIQDWLPISESKNLLKRYASR